VLEAAQRATGLSPNKARALLGRFLFSGEEAEKPLAGLSGGERRRLSLAVLVGAATPPNVLILDEPTNHLDIESREALEDALRAFPGAVLLVSHDRALLDAVGKRTLAVQEHTLRSYLGGWPEYVRAREEARAGAGAGTGGGASSADGDARAAPAAANGSLKAAPGAGARNGAAGEGESQGGGLARKRQRAKPKQAGPSKNRVSAQQQAEQAVEAAEQSLRALEDELADPAAWATRYDAAKSEARHTAAKRAVESAYEQLQALLD